MRLTPGLHRIRAVFAGVSAVGEIDVQPGDINTVQIWYRDAPEDLEETVIPAGVNIEQIYRC